MNVAVVRRLAMTALGIAAAYALSRQCRRPAGWLGRRLARTMNLTHASLTGWGLQHVRIEPGWRVLDVGCGGGQTIRSMAAMAPAGRVEGIDYSEASVAVARQKNMDLLAPGRVAIQRASVSQLPFPDGSFDLVTAVETHYYWPDLRHDLREILRVLKPGGRIVIIAETYKGRRMDWLYRPVMRFLLRATYLSLEEHREALAEAGFTDVAIDAERTRGWMCAVGARPAGGLRSQGSFVPRVSVEGRGSSVDSPNRRTRVPSRLMAESGSFARCERAIYTFNRTDRSRAIARCFWNRGSRIVASGWAPLPA